MNRLIARKLILYLMLGSIGGLLLCRVVDMIFFRSGVHLDETKAGLWVIRILAIIFAVTVIVVPLNILLNRSDVREVQKLWADGEINPEEMHPFWKHLFYMNYGEVPRRVYLPFIVLAAILAGIFAFGLIAFIFLGLLWLILRLFGY